MTRIAIAGWQHETNTFSPQLATYEAFSEADEWPGLSVGEVLFETTDGVHLPITGAIEVLREAGCQLVPLLWGSAGPCSYVTDEAFERICGQLIAKLSDALLDDTPLDGVYLDLHGAMVAASYPDGEGEILRRVRAVVGDEMPVAVSLDMHANVTEGMMARATVLDIFRTYPHIDMGETGARTARHLLKLLAGEAWFGAMRKSDFLIPLNWGCTVTEPMASMMERLPGVINDEVPAASLAVGFHLSDFDDVGPAVVAYGKSQAAADQAVDTMVGWIHAAKADFAGEVLMPEVAVERALGLCSKATGPVILADTQDNPGGGGCGDTTGVLAALIAAKAKGAVVATIADGESARLAHEAGVGAVIDLMLGDKTMPGHSPLPVTAIVKQLGDGRVVATGPMYKGARMQLGLMALLDIKGVLVILTSTKVQVADQSIVRAMGLEPAEQSIISLKSSVHFRNDFQDLAADILIVKAPGAVVVEPAELDYRFALRR